MQTSKPRNGTLEVPKKVSPRAVRKPKPTALETESSSSPKQAIRTPKERSPKVVVDRRSPKSPVVEKKRPSKISELELQIAQLQEQLKKAKDQITESESWKKQAQLEAEESQKELLTMSSKLEESRKLLVELENSSKDENQVSKSVEEHDSAEFTDLASAVNQIQRLKAELQAAETKEVESENLELESLKGNLMETLSLVEEMKIQLKDSKESEANAQVVASETLMQLESAKESIEALRSESAKNVEAYNSIASELDQSNARVKELEDLVAKFTADSAEAPNYTLNENVEKDEKSQLEAEVTSLKNEIEQLRAALESKSRGEEMGHGASQNKVELLAELEKAKMEIEEMKKSFMDKENELHGIVGENEELHMKVEERDTELQIEVKKLNEVMADLKADMMDKENELQNISEENETLRLKISKRGQENGNADDEGLSREKEALMKLGLAMEEAEKNNRRAARVAEQLNAAQSVNSEMEAELRKLKVQSDQWRKAAEAAAAMISAGNNNGKLMERTGSLDSHYNAVAGKVDSPFADEMDDDLIKKKNGNVLKKIGVLWKKPQK